MAIGNFLKSGRINGILLSFLGPFRQICCDWMKFPIHFLKIMKTPFRGFLKEIGSIKGIFPFPKKP